jgi:hypothetical protein
MTAFLDRVLIGLQTCATKQVRIIWGQAVNIHTHLWAAGLLTDSLATFRETCLKQCADTTWAYSATIAVLLSSAIL